MTIETKAREWADKEAKQFSEDAYALPVYKVNELMERAYLAGAAGAMEWVSVSERLPEDSKLKEICYMDGEIQRHAFARHYKYKQEVFEPEDWNDYEDATFLDHDNENGISWLKPGFYREHENEYGEFIQVPVKPTHWKELSPLPPHPEKEQL